MVTEPTTSLPDSDQGCGALPATAGASATTVTSPFTDTAEIVLDAKGRIALPAHARAGYAAGGFLTSWQGPCVAAFTPEGFAQWIDHLRRALPTSGFDDPAGHLRLAHAQAFPFKPDIQGRFLLPERFRHTAGIDREVTVVGAGSRVELWNPATYGRDLDDARQNLEFLQASFDLPLPGGL